jgi:hypothetical protein
MDTDFGLRRESRRAGATPLLEAIGSTESGVAAALQSSLRFAPAGCHRSPNRCRPGAKLQDFIGDFLTRIIKNLSRQKASLRRLLQDSRTRDENEDEEDLTGAGKFKKPRFRRTGKFHRLAAYSGMAATRLYVVFIHGLKSR